MMSSQETSTTSSTGANQQSNGNDKNNVTEELLKIVDHTSDILKDKLKSLGVSTFTPPQREGLEEVQFERMMRDRLHRKGEKDLQRQASRTMDTTVDLFRSRSKAMGGGEGIEDSSNKNEGEEMENIYWHSPIVINGKEEEKKPEPVAPPPTPVAEKSLWEKALPYIATAGVTSALGLGALHFFGGGGDSGSTNTNTEITKGWLIGATDEPPKD